MEIEKKHSINTTEVPVEHQGYKYNFLTPRIIRLKEKFVQGSATASIIDYHGDLICWSAGRTREGVEEMQ